MALVARYMIDTSALARAHLPRVADRIIPLIEAGLVATWHGLDAEVLYTARDAREYALIRTDRHMAYEHLPLADDHWTAAFDAWQVLAKSGKHRAIGLIDLLTAVLAARHNLLLLHYDSDFELAASVIDLDQDWVVPRGSLS